MIYDMKTRTFNKPSWQNETSHHGLQSVYSHNAMAERVHMLFLRKIMTRTPCQLDDEHILRPLHRRLELW